MHRTLLENIHARICYSGIIDSYRVGEKSQQHDVVYYAACPEPGCTENYTGETGVIDHNGRVKKSHLYKHSQESTHPCVALSDIKIISTKFQNQKFKRKIAAD